MKGYKLIELAGEQEAEALSLVLQALVNATPDYNVGRSTVKVEGTKDGHIIVMLAES